MDELRLKVHLEIMSEISKYNFDRVSKVRGRNLESILYLSSFRLIGEASAYSQLSLAFGHELIEKILIVVNEALAHGHLPMSHFSAKMASWYTSPYFNLEYSELEREFKRQRLIDGYASSLDLNKGFRFGLLYDAFYSVYKHIDLIRAPAKERSWNNTNKSFYKRNQISSSIKKDDKTFEAGWCAYYHLKLLARHSDQIKMYAKHKGFSSLLSFMANVPKFELFTLDASTDTYCTQYFSQFSKVFENIELILAELFCFLYERKFGPRSLKGGITGNDVPVFEHSYFVDSLVKEGSEKSIFLIFDYDDFDGLLRKFTEHYLNVAA
ncbi:hypothetical protein [Pseudoalteromonas marina]|uniref:Uncharacterized protein n=1 Tax=Pseudoalteromonas marina TaxID=267375 RepID=A0ABT9FHX1_9GAMM|nr:hypothetical protein [Pseudoalteromonas marina]MDP2566395.1 hypothetical protein [Pseudoalteromonas marina]